jgi:hypothetical protein
MHLVCPYCGKHLRTDRSHAGREGLCPRCEKIFQLPEPRPAQRVASEDAPEYGSTTVLALSGAVGLGLLMLAVSSLLDWSRFTGAEALFLDAQKMAIVVGSLACLVAIGVALAGRKTLLPAILVSGAWGITAAVWVGGTAAVMGRLVGDLHSSPVRAGLYVALVAACVVVVVSGYLLLQLRHEGLFRGLPAVFGGLQMAGIVAGLLIVTCHVSPGLQARAGTSLPAVQEQPEHNPLYVSPGEDQSNVTIGNKDWIRGERIRRGQD